MALLLSWILLAGVPVVQLEKSCGFFWLPPEVKNMKGGWVLWTVKKVGGVMCMISTFWAFRGGDLINSVHICTSSNKSYI